MPKVRLLNNLTGEYIEYDEPEQEAMPPPTASELEARYKARVADLIHLQYSSDRESGLQNEAIAALASAEPLPLEYIDYIAYREKCRNDAHLEVYGVER